MLIRLIAIIFLFFIASCSHEHAHRELSPPERSPASITHQCSELLLSFTRLTGTNLQNQNPEIGIFYQFEELPLGEGHTSIVFKGILPSQIDIPNIPKEWIEQHTEIAIKRPRLNLSSVESLKQEAIFSEKISQVDHDHLFLKYYYDEKRNVLISEYKDNFQSLQEWINLQNDGIKIQDYQLVFSQLEKVLETLKEAKLVHSDLGFENILINPTNLKIQVIDYGIMSDIGKYSPTREKLFFNKRGGRIKSDNQKADLPALLSDDKHAINKVMNDIRKKVQLSIDKENLSSEVNISKIISNDPQSKEWLYLVTRNGNLSDKSYPQRIYDSIKYFFDPFVEETLKGKKNNFEEMLRFQHMVLSRGLDGSNKYFGASMGIWNKLFRNAAVPGAFRNEEFKGPMFFRWRLKIPIPDKLDGEIPAGVSKELASVNLEGIPEEFLPKRIKRGNYIQYFHPSPKAVPIYLTLMEEKIRKAILMIKNKNAPEKIIPLLADYVQLGVSGHIFGVGNFSIYMTQVNDLLIRMGLHGISPQNLDYHAFVEDSPFFRERFAKIVYSSNQN